jgi:hypothetical protein
MAEAERCATCRWWSTENGVDWGVAATIPAAWQLCDMGSQTPGDSPAQFGAPADLIFTAPDFGCVQWEARADG